MKELTRQRVPLQWATIQNNLGVALRHLGIRERGTAQLQEAIAALREALQERTLERVPVERAATQFNLAAAFVALAEKTKDKTPLREALSAAEEALDIFRIICSSNDDGVCARQCSNGFTQCSGGQQSSVAPRICCIDSHDIEIARDAPMLESVIENHKFAS